MTPLGFKTGMGKPVEFLKWVLQVWVQYCISTHHGIWHTRTMVLQICMGELHGTGEPCIHCFCFGVDFLIQYLFGVMV